MGNSVGVFASSNFGGVEWDTVGSNDWDVLGSNPLVVSGIGDWGGNVSSVRCGNWSGVGMSNWCSEWSGICAVGNEWSSYFIDFVTILVDDGGLSAVGEWGSDDTTTLAVVD
jgi:hypothetical protein